MTFTSSRLQANRVHINISDRYVLSHIHSMPAQYSSSIYLLYVPIESKSHKRRLNGTAAAFIDKNGHVSMVYNKFGALKE